MRWRRSFIFLFKGHIRTSKLFTTSQHHSFYLSPSCSFHAQYKTTAALPPPPLRAFPSSGFDELDPSKKIEEERLPQYVAERYYPVRIGEVFESRYQVITKLGFGSSSTIWLCRDLCEDRYLTLKVHVRSKGQIPEISISNSLSKIQDPAIGEKFVRRIIDYFEITGPHGTHHCLLYRPAGVDISDYIRCLPGGALTEDLLRPLVRIILIALEYLHQANVVHTDIQPNNILLGIDDESVLSKVEQDELEKPIARKVLANRTIYQSRWMPLTDGEPILTDLGEARLCEEKQRGLIMPSIYRAPEVMLDMDWDNKVDIWGLAQTIWTIFEHGHLFENINPQGTLDNSRRFAEMISLLGPPPAEFLKRSKESLKYWDEDGKWKDFFPIPEQTLESREQQFEGKDKALFLQFMRKMLRWLPEERPTAEELVYDDWLRADDY